MTTRMDCESAREQIDAYALEALDAEESRALEAHLATCDECARLLDEARETGSSIAMVVPLRGASAALKSRVMAAAAVLTDINRPRTQAWWRAAVAALFIVGIGAVSWGSFVQVRMNDLQDENASISAAATVQSDRFVALETQADRGSSETHDLAELVDTTNAVLDVAFQEDAQHTELNGTAMAPAAKGRCVWSRTQALGAFIAQDMPPPPPSYMYEMWMVYEQRWISGGTFMVDADGRGHLLMRRTWGDGEDLGAFEGFAVTLEPTSGPAGPSERLVLQSVVRQ